MWGCEKPLVGMAAACDTLICPRTTADAVDVGVGVARALPRAATAVAAAEGAVEGGVAVVVAAGAATGFVMFVTAAVAAAVAAFAAGVAGRAAACVLAVAACLAEGKEMLLRFLKPWNQPGDALNEPYSAWPWRTRSCAHSRAYSVTKKTEQGGRGCQERTQRRRADTMQCIFFFWGGGSGGELLSLYHAISTNTTAQSSVHSPTSLPWNVSYVEPCAS